MPAAHREMDKSHCGSRCGEIEVLDRQLNCDAGESASYYVGSREQGTEAKLSSHDENEQREEEASGKHEQTYCPSEDHELHVDVMARRWRPRLVSAHTDQLKQRACHYGRVCAQDQNVGVVSNFKVGKNSQWQDGKNEQPHRAEDDGWVKESPARGSRANDCDDSQTERDDECDKGGHY